jgi:type IV pilus assembly protein PilY1
VALALSGLSPLIFAAPLVLTQGPTSVARQPAPNIIVSVDNSTSMGSTGVAELKAALRATFSPSNLPDNQIRLAWQSMHGCNSIPGSNTSSTGICRGFNGLRRFSGTHRSNFLTWVDSIGNVRGTPSHQMMANAGDYLSLTGLGVNSPWASDPGVTESPVLSCRRSYHILMTDGEYGHSWARDELDTSGPANTRIVRGGNADGTNTVLPDGRVYSVDSANTQTRLYRDAWGHSGLSTLSDLAFYYWSRDLQPGIPNEIRPSPDQPAPNENFGTTSSPAILESYWNPRYNPATWQHMVTYTIGFKSAAQWSTATGYPRWQGDTFSGLAPLIQGTTPWVTPFCNTGNRGAGNLPCDGGANYENRADARKADLWHTALNSRGRFIPAPDAQSLVAAFQSIIAGIQDESRQMRVSIAANTSTLRTAGRVYLASFNTRRSSGEVSAYQLAAGTGVISSTPAWTTSTTLDSAAVTAATRNILSHSGGALGIPFAWNSLSLNQRNAIRGADTDTVAQQRMDYLRGDRSREGSQFRQRDSRMGTVVNSNIWITSAPKRMTFEHQGHTAFRRTYGDRNEAIYIGANDGMLHGFDAATGVERFAYVPMAAYASLREYASPQYNHRFFVDGHPFTGDADLSWVPGDPSPLPEPRWRTVLVSGLGGGGRGFFALDVTDPTNVTTSSVLLDRTFPGSPAAAPTGLEDVGHIYGAPVTDLTSGGRSEQIVKLNNSRWAVVMGNGVNSVNERPVLLIQYLDGDKSLRTIVAHSTTGQSNGLAPPRLIDINGNGTVDVAYAGDLQGQLWKFNLSSARDEDWGVSAWDSSAAPCKNATTCKPLFVAKDGASPANTQPITTAPMWMSHPLGGIQVMFGTGQNIQPSDPANTRVQTIYSIWDKSRFTTLADRTVVFEDIEPIETVSPVVGRSRLVQQSVTGAVTKTDPSNTGTVDTIFSNSTNNDVSYSRTVSTARRGWFMDLPISGERVLNAPMPFQGQRVLIASTAPSPDAGGESCSATSTAERSRLTVLNMITGKPPTSAVFFSSDASMNLANATSVMVDSTEFISLDSINRSLDLISVKNDGYRGGPELGSATSGSGSSGSGSTPDNGEGSAQQCAGNGCLARGRMILGDSDGARADWREVR